MVPVNYTVAIFTSMPQKSLGLIMGTQNISTKIILSHKVSICAEGVYPPSVIGPFPHFSHTPHFLE